VPLVDWFFGRLSEMPLAWRSKVAFEIRLDFCEIGPHVPLKINFNFKVRISQKSILQTGRSHSCGLNLAHTSITLQPIQDRLEAQTREVSVNPLGLFELSCIFHHKMYGLLEILTG
jgi:hypothetical protein